MDVEGWDVPKAEGEERDSLGGEDWSVGLLNSAFINHRFHIRSNSISLKSAKFRAREVSTT
jgi:hypothetical protein